jgi:outer membrane protein with beta-barrel domain
VVRAIRALALVFLFTVIVPARASAEWQFAPFVGFNFLGETNLNLTELPKRHWMFGGSARLVGAGPLGLESLFTYVPGAFQARPLDLDPFIFNTNKPSEPITKSHAFALMGNIVLTTPRAWSEYGLRPYVSGGMGLLQVYHNYPANLARGNLLGYNVGGGAVGFLTDRVGLRFDLRYVSTTPHGREPSEEILTDDNGRVRVHFWTATVGVVFKY